MHLLIGSIRIILAHLLATVYRICRAEAIGRKVVRLACSAFTASAGLDDAALAVVQRLGPPGRRLLELESYHEDQNGVAALMLKMLRASGDA